MLETFPVTFSQFLNGVMTLTIKDIAKACGVSVSTVSRVLNDHPDVSAANREKVLAVVDALHYVPNNSARDLVKAPSDTIGLVVHGIGNPFFTNVVYGIEDACSRAGYTLVLYQTQSGEDELHCAAQLARSKRLRGLIFLGGRFEYTPEDIAGLDIPFVCCTYTNRFGSLSPDAYSSVSIDDEKEAYQIVSVLTRRGHKKIGIILDRLADHSISQLRFDGYCQALAESGIPLDRDLVEETITFEMADGYRAMTNLLSRRDDMTAVFVISDALAVAAMKALHDHGKRIPEDCCVVAIDGIEMSNYTFPTLTTLIQPQKEMGRKAVEILVDILEGRGGHRHITVDTTIREGGSICTL